MIHSPSPLPSIEAKHSHRQRRRSLSPYRIRSTSTSWSFVMMVMVVCGYILLIASHPVKVFVVSYVVRTTENFEEEDIIDLDTNEIVKEKDMEEEEENKDSTDVRIGETIEDDLLVKDDEHTREEVMIEEESFGMQRENNIDVPFNEEETNKTNELIQTFQSIQDLYTVLEQQQQQAQQTQAVAAATTEIPPLQPIYWVILIVQPDEKCTKTTNATTATTIITKVYNRAAQYIHQWNEEWYKNLTTETAKPSNTIDVPLIQVGQLSLQSEYDQHIIVSQLHIESTPSIVLLSTQPILPPRQQHKQQDTQSYGPVYVVEYTGIQSTSIGMANSIRHYFDTISPLRSQPILHQNRHFEDRHNATNPLVLVESRHFISIQQLQLHLMTYTPRLFGGMHTTLHLTDDTNETTSSYVNSSTTTAFNRLVLSKEMTSPEERFYIHWLFEGGSSTTTPTNSSSSTTLTTNHSTDDHNYVLLIVQCRLQQYDDSLSREPLYDDFDTMARTLQARRDLLFVILQPQSPLISKNQKQSNEKDNDWCANVNDGGIHVYEIPTRYNSDDEDDQDVIVKVFSKPPKEWKNTFVSYQYSPNNEVIGTTRLVEFLVKVCTDTVLWYDRQIVAPIAFPVYREVHAILVIGMHHESMTIATETYHALNSNTINTTLLLNDNPRTIVNRRTVTDFRRTCRQHRLHYQHSIIEYDMVCIIIPSTETRILTTFGITEMWTQIDDAVNSFNPQTFRTQNHANTTRLHERLTLPRLLITDQRYSGTRRYYKDLVPLYLSNADSRDTNPIAEFVTKFWSNELQHVVKSGPKQIKEINDSGIHILTANSIASKLYNRTIATIENNSHALVLLTTATCGHCKRIWIIWNQLGRLLQTIGWNTFLTLYQIDVSENDVSATAFNVSVDWVPDVYYVSPDRTKRIRYNVTDELGDTIGGVRTAMEIIDWLIHDVGNDFLDEESIEKLLVDLDTLSLDVAERK
jgi:hypothetical protein